MTARETRIQKIISDLWFEWQGEAGHSTFLAFNAFLAHKFEAAIEAAVKGSIGWIEGAEDFAHEQGWEAFFRELEGKRDG